MSESTGHSIDDLITNPQPGDPIVRFLYSSRHFAETSGRVKHRAFMPPDKKQEISVFQTRNLSSSEVKALDSKVAKMRSDEKHAKAYAEFKVESVQQVDGLFVDPDNTPPRHAHIKGFPNDKGAKMLKAKELANQNMSLIML